MEQDARAPLPAPRDPHVPERRFRDEEVSAILARAASREARPDLPTPHDPTLSDLMAAAAEVGLDPAEVRRAAALQPPPPRRAVDVVLGAPDHREVTARLEGARIPVDTYELVRWAEAAFGTRGEVTESAPGRFEWRADGVGSRSRLTLVERDGALELTAASDRSGDYAGFLFMGLLAWMALAMMTPLGSVPPLLQLLAFFATPPLVARPFWARASRRLQARLEGLALDVLRAADEAGPAALPPEEAGDGA